MNLTSTLAPHKRGGSWASAEVSPNREYRPSGGVTDLSMAARRDDAHGESRLPLPLNRGKSTLWPNSTGLDRSRRIKKPWQGWPMLINNIPEAGLERAATSRCRVGKPCGTRGMSGCEVALFDSRRTADLSVKLK